MISQLHKILTYILNHVKHICPNSMDNTLASKTHIPVRKRVKMHRKPTSGANKYDKHIITWKGKGERYARSNPVSGDAT